jgi:polysaccharide pyruvyl transferase CsaB
VRLRVGISGSYGGLNLGDEAILESIVGQLRRDLTVEITVFSRNPEDTKRRHGVERAVAVRELTRKEAKAEVARLDLLILGGGGILYDKEAQIYLREVFLAHETGVPVMVYAVSAGPLKRPEIRDSVRRALNGAALVSVRDREGKQLLEDVGVEQEIHVMSDPAWLIDFQPVSEERLRREGIEPGRRLLGFSVREPGPAAPDINVDHYHSLLANAADFMIERLDADIVFVPMERDRMDMQHSHAVVSRMQCAQRATVLKSDWTPGQLLTLIGHFDFVVGMRLHFLIFAARNSVPFVALPYASKVSGLLRDLEIDMPVMNDVDAGRLLAIIDRSWDLRANLRSDIQKRVPILQERARQTHQMLMDLLPAAARAM